MRKTLPAAAAVATALTLALPAAAHADTGTADLAVTKLTFHVVNQSTIRVKAVATNLGPDPAEPAIVLDVWGGTITKTACTYGKQRIPDSSDGDTCEMVSLPDTTFTPVGFIITMHVTRPTNVSASARVYDLGDTTDPNSANDGMYRSRNLLPGH